MKLARIGLRYEATDVEEGIAMRLERVRESRGEISGELTVERAPEGHLLRHRFNVSSMAARKATAGYLSSRSNSVDWIAGLEEFCLYVLTEESRREPFVTVGNAPRRPAPPRRIAPIIPEGAATEVYAPQGTRKSMFAAACAVSVATGEEIVPGLRPTPGRVLVLDWEADSGEWNDRISRIAEGAELEPPDILYRHCFGSLEEQVEEIAELVAREGVVFVIVDSMTWALSSGREGADPADAIRRFYEARSHIGGTTLILDHVTGDDAASEGPIRKAYGSVAKMWRARATYELRAEREPVPGRVEFVLRCEKLNDAPRLAPMGFAMIYDGLTGPVRFETSRIQAPELQVTLSQPERIVRLLLAEGALHDETIAGKLGIPAGNVRTALARDSRLFRLDDRRIGVRLQ